MYYVKFLRQIFNNELLTMEVGGSSYFIAKVIITAIIIIITAIIIIISTAKTNDSIIIIIISKQTNIINEQAINQELLILITAVAAIPAAVAPLPMQGKRKHTAGLSRYTLSVARAGNSCRSPTTTRALAPTAVSPSASALNFISAATSHPPTAVRWAAFGFSASPPFRASLAEKPLN